MRALGREIIADWLVGELKFLSSNFEARARGGQGAKHGSREVRGVAQSVLAGGWPASSERNRKRRRARRGGSHEGA